ncbi:MAG: PAS domain S-box protein [Rhodothermaceae bacterium]|nr:PAS domain S-box protein [Rhodothermaceae bacterium]
MPFSSGSPPSALLDAGQAALDDAALIDAVAPEQDKGASRIAPLRRFLDAFLPEEMRRARLDVRRRARFVVVIAFVVGPFYSVLVQQLLASGLVAQAAVGAACGLVTLACPFLLRRLNSHVVPGSIVCVLLSFVIFFQAYSDAGLEDPILYWSALVPLVAALSVGSRLSLVTAVLNLSGIGLLYGLTVQGHTFPHLTEPAGLQVAALASVSTATLFALAWGWIYERHTLRELRMLNDRLSALRSALVESEERYRSLFDNVPLGVYRTSSDGRVLMVNPALVKLLGYPTADEVKALDSASMVYANPEQRQRFRDQIERDGEVQQFASTWKRRDGRRLHVRENARAVFDEEGNALYFEGVVEDVTNQRRVQQALRKSEERFRSLVQNASDLTAVLDARGTMTYLSPSVERILGYTAEDLLGRPPFDLVHPDDRRRTRLLFRRAAMRRGDIGALECRILHADGHYIYIDSVGTNLLHDANIGGLVINARDVTERKRAETVLVQAKEQAEEVARLKSAFLANMSHEIRTPLTGILGFAGILAEEVEDEQQQEFVGLIEKSGRRLMDTLNSVLDLARLEAGRMDLMADPQALSLAADDVVRLLQPLAQERGLRLTTRVLAPSVMARVDSGALDRILTNLVGNAIKFTDEGSITVEVDADETNAFLRVVDTGVGVDPAFLPRLFNEFEQESTGIGRSHEGSGLGLTITRQLVERMNGTITVESTKGEGAVFTVQFPRADALPLALPEAPAAEPEPEPAHTLLVVDDNHDTRLLMRRMLRRQYHVETASTAQEALESATGTPFDAILLDINLGAKTSGEDVMRRLRELPAYATTPILAFTAYALPGDRERFLSAGFDGYLAKPFTRRQLLDTLGGMLDDAPAASETEATSFHILISGPAASKTPPPMPSGDGAAEHTTPPEPVG